MGLGYYCYDKGADNNWSITRNVKQLLEDYNFSDAMELVGFGFAFPKIGDERVCFIVVCHMCYLISYT